MSDDGSLAINRVLRQELEGWRRAGLSDLPMPPRKRTVTTNQTKPTATRTPPASGAAPPVAAPQTTPRSVMAPPTPAVQALPVISEPLPPSPHPAGSRE